MTTITSFGHSAIGFGKEGRHLLIDPGVFNGPDALAFADAVLITHIHPDHLAVEPLVESSAEIWGDRDVIDLLGSAGVVGTRLHVVAPGDAFTAAGFDIVAFGGEHAVIHPDLPPSINIAYLIDGVYLHPGDSLAESPEGATIDILFVPISAPWLKLAEAIDYLRAVAPATAVPIHDETLTGPGRVLTDATIDALRGNINYRRLAPGESF